MIKAIELPAQVKNEFRHTPEHNLTRLLQQYGMTQILGEAVNNKECEAKAKGRRSEA